MNDSKRPKPPLSPGFVLYWGLNVGCPIVFLAVALWEHRQFLARAEECHNVIPLLSGPAQFTVLTLVVALAAYLRSVRTGALEFRDEIRANKVWNYPTDFDQFPFTEQKLVLLDGVAVSIQTVSPFFIQLSMVIAIRIVAEAYIKYHAGGLQCNGWLIITDTIIALWICLGLAGLAFTHFTARARDAEITQDSRRAEDKALMLLEERRIEKATNLSKDSPIIVGDSK